MSVKMAEKNPLATCDICQGLAVSGKLEREEFEKRMSPSANQKGKPKLTDMQRAFAAHPEVTTNPRKAAIDAGYSEKYAKSHASALRAQMAPLIMQYQEKAVMRSAISVAKVQQELASMGFANIIDYFEMAEDGTMMPKRLTDLTREQTAAIQEMKLGEFPNPDTGEVEYRLISLKLADKRANLVELGKSIGMFTPRGPDDSEEQNRIEQLKHVSTEDLEKAERLLMDAIKKGREQKSINSAVEGEFDVLPPPVEQEDP